PGPAWGETTRKPGSGRSGPGLWGCAVPVVGHRGRGGHFPVQWEVSVIRRPRHTPHTLRSSSILARSPETWPQTDAHARAGLPVPSCLVSDSIPSLYLYTPLRYTTSGWYGRRGGGTAGTRHPTDEFPGSGRSSPATEHTAPSASATTVANHRTTHRRAMTVVQLLAVVPTADFDTARAWYTRLAGRPADRSPMDGCDEWQLTGSG